MNKCLIALIIFVASVLPAAAAELTAPDALAKSVSEEVLAVLRSDKDIQSGNLKKVGDLIEAKVLPHFNFGRMTQLAVGRHWRDATAEQKSQLTGEFRSLLVRTYATAFTQYKDQQLEFKPLRLAPSDTDVVVRSLIRQSGGQPVSIDYSMEKSDRGWKVYDVKIEGISLVENYRNTFNSEVQKNGVDGLIKSLSAKNRTVAQASAK